MNYAADADGAESVVSAITGKGGRAMAVRADVASEADVEAMFGVAREQMGPLAALVNNAGSSGEFAHIDEQHQDALTRLMQVNVVGRCCAPSTQCGPCRPRTAGTADRL